MKLRIHALFILTLFAGIILITVNSASARTGELVRVLELSPSGYERAHALAFSPDGNHLAVGGTSGIYLFDTQQLSEPDFIQTNVWARSLIFLPQNNQLVAGLFDNTVKFWNITDPNPLKTMDAPDGWVRSIATSHDGSLIAAASDDNTIRIWQTGSDELKLVLNDLTGVRVVALSPDGTLIAGALSDNTVRVWKVSNGELLYTLNSHKDWPRCLAFSPDGQLLASCGFDRTIRLWSISNGNLMRVLEGHKSSILGIAFSPDGQTIASGSVDQTVRVWNVSDGSQIKILQGHTDFVYAVAFSLDGKTLASGGGDNTLRLWSLENLTVYPDEAIPDVPSDCRQCHHRRGQNEPARVIDLSCEACHAGGIGLSWCTAFPRSSLAEQTPIHYNATYDVSGVPVNQSNVAIVIASPGNGETFYAMGNSLAPEIISGRVYVEDKENITKINVHLDIVSDGKTTASLKTNPNANGDFTFNVAINPNSPPSYSSKPATRQCTQCHDDSLAQAGIPTGTVHFVVTAVTPDGQSATDSRWARVDASGNAALPIQIVDAETNEPLNGLSVEATTILYQWRERFSSITTGGDGMAQLELEELSQAPTTYNLTIPPQILNGILYVSPEAVITTLNSGTNETPVTLKAQAMKGRIEGHIVEGNPTNLWAIQLPAGPVYQITSTLQNTFTFEDIPVGQYLLTADVFALAEKNLYATPQEVDLFTTPETQVEISPVAAKPITGSIESKDGNFLPFTWVHLGKHEMTQAGDPSSGKFLLPNLPEVDFITASSPGYYALPQEISDTDATLNFQLTPRPETQFIAWNDGQIVLPSETTGSMDGLEFDLSSGWLWGESNTASEILSIHLPNLDVQVSSGSFALEYPAAGMGWLYVHRGEAKVSGPADQPQVIVRGGEMLALMGNVNPIPMEPSVIMAFHPILEKSPVSEIIEPTLNAKIRSWLAKAGIGTLQIITFITYILSLAALSVIVLRGLFLIRKSSPDEETSNAVKHHK
ncbi:MAG: WD40 repeat domain-containing protein [Anaerolineales bacterium]|nr:WD40 repeat domain-containing protein [Anaerolineales bacterium]